MIPLALEPVPIQFASHGQPIAAHLYLPPGPREAKPPVVVVTGAWMTVKEQMPAVYARELARRGFAALTFDFRGWGQSGGARRQYEAPQEKIEDIGAAIQFLRTRPEVDGGRIGALGICASSGYMVHAAVSSKDLKSVALVAPWLHDRALVEATYGGPEGVAKLKATAQTAEEAYAKTGKPSFVPAASLTDERAIMFKVPYYTEPDRGMIPAWRNEADPAFWPGWLDFDGVAPAPRLNQPFFMVHSEAAAIPDGAKRFYAGVRGDKGQLWLENVTQLDFYDRPEPVTRASDAVAAHFARTLMTEAERERLDEAALAGAREFFAALEAGDIPRFLRGWAEDGVQEMPFAPGRFPKRLEGRAAVERQYGPLPAAYEGMRFPLRRLVPTGTPGTVLAEYDGSIGLKGGGRYDNRYVGLFRFDADGKLAHFTEYFDPYVLVRGFPGAEAMGAPDSEQIEGVILRLASGTDARDWAEVRKLFGEEVDVDYTSVTGGAPGPVRAEDLVAGWTTGLGRYAETKHHFGDVRAEVKGDEATALFTGQATHRKASGERWTCGGDYTFRLRRTQDGWRIVAARFDMRWEQGVR